MSRTDILCKLTLAQAKQIFKAFDEYAKSTKTSTSEQRSTHARLSALAK